MGQDIDYKILLDSFKFTPLDDKMITLVQELKEKYHIGMVTDNKYDRIRTILDYRGLLIIQREIWRCLNRWECSLSYLMMKIEILNCL